MWEPTSHPTVLLAGSTSQSSAILVAHSVTLNIPHQGQSENGNSDPAWAVPWDPMGLAGIPRGLLSEVPDLPSRLPPFLPFPPLPSFPFLLYDRVPSPMSGTGYRAGTQASEKPVGTQTCQYVLPSSVLATGPWSSPKLCGSLRCQKGFLRQVILHFTPKKYTETLRLTAYST